MSNYRTNTDFAKSTLKAILISSILMQATSSTCDPPTDPCNYKDNKMMTNDLDRVYWTDSSVSIKGSTGGINVNGKDNWDDNDCCADRTIWYISGDLQDVWPRYQIADVNEDGEYEDNLPGPRN